MPKYPSGWWISDLRIVEMRDETEVELELHEQVVEDADVPALDIDPAEHPFVEKFPIQFRPRKPADRFVRAGEADAAEARFRCGHFFSLPSSQTISKRTTIE